MSKIVNRTMDLLEAFADQKKPLSLTDLVRLLGIPLSSCHDVVHALERRGYLYEVKARGGYYPTSKLYNMARAFTENDLVAIRAAPILDRLAETLNASISLAKARGTQLTYLLVSLPADPLVFSVTPGAQARNLYATSVGKALLASFSPADRKAIVDGLTLDALTPATITSKARLLKELVAGEARGWFTNREESVEDAMTVSVRLQWGGSIYVVTAAGTLKRMERQLDAVVAGLRGAVAALGGDA
jgi:DNA-binding IclR family transcriptional regulator